MLIHHAAGGVGTAVAQICNALGASLVIGTASAPKRDFVESLGMRFVDREEEDFVDVCKSLTRKRSPSCNRPGRWQTPTPIIQVAKEGGKLYYFGASAAVKGNRRSRISEFRMWWGMPRFDPLKLMSSNKAVFGVHMGLLEDESVFKGHLDDLSRMLSDGKLIL